MKKKKRIYIALFLLVLVIALTAQPDKRNNKSASAGGGKCFNESSHIINIGVGFLGGNYYRYTKNGAYSYHTSPALNISYEQSLPKKVGPGYLGVGAYLGYQTAYYRYNDYYYNGERYYYKHNWRYTLLAFRAAYHLEDLISDNAELYFGVSAGVRIQSYNFETNSLDPLNNSYQLHNGNIYPAYSLFVGGRFYFTKNIGVFGELGYGISYLTGGLSFKF